MKALQRVIDAPFSTAFDQLLATKQSAGSSGPLIQVDWMNTDVGPLVFGATDEALCLLEFSDAQRLGSQINSLLRTFVATLRRGGSSHISQARLGVSEYLAGRRKHFDVPLAARGTAFQQRVWKALTEIPYGKTCSYRDIARKVGDDKACRAVGTANGMNRLAIIVPCHRVVNSTGALGGYGGGLLRKQFLLDIERGQLQLPT